MSEKSNVVHIDFSRGRRIIVAYRTSIPQASAQRGDVFYKDIHRYPYGRVYRKVWISFTLPIFGGKRFLVLRHLDNFQIRIISEQRFLMFWTKFVRDEMPRRSGAFAVFNGRPHQRWF